MPFDAWQSTLWQLDITLLRFLNVTLASPVSDQFWDNITQLHKLAWVKFGVFPFLLLFLFSRFRWHAWKPILVVGLAIAISDLFSYRVLKSHIHRQRPFQNSEVSTWVRKVGEAHGPSFPSNHATNIFAAAVVLAWYFRRQRYLFYTFAFLVALSRPALGVHYPSDVLAGAILGICVGVLVRKLLLRRVEWLGTLGPVPNMEANSFDWRVRSRRLKEP